MVVTPSPTTPATGAPSTGRSPSCARRWCSDQRRRTAWDRGQPSPARRRGSSRASAPRARGRAATRRWGDRTRPGSVDQLAGHVPVEHRAQQLLAPHRAAATRRRRPGELDDPVVEQRQAALQPRRHARQVDLREHAVGEHAELVAEHHVPDHAQPGGAIARAGERRRLGGAEGQRARVGPLADQRLVERRRRRRCRLPRTQRRAAGQLLHLVAQVAESGARALTGSIRRIRASTRRGETVRRGRAGARDGPVPAARRRRSRAALPST